VPDCQQCAGGNLSLAALGRGTPNTPHRPAIPQPPAVRRLSRALVGPVAVRGPVRVALAAGLLVAGRARRHAAADAAALEARPGAPVLVRLRAAPHVAGAPAVCDHRNVTGVKRRQEQTSSVNAERTVRQRRVRTFGGVDDLVRRRPDGRRRRVAAARSSLAKIRPESSEQNQRGEQECMLELNPFGYLAVAVAEQEESRHQGDGHRELAGRHRRRPEPGLELS
jgi:hypothetical protein